MSRGMSGLLSEIRDVQTELMRLMPHRDAGLVPNPGASREALAAVERRLRCELPLEYREFLALHDGWPRFFEGATLLGTTTLGRQEHEETASAIFAAAETPVHGLGQLLGPRRRRLLPFGIDPQATTVFAFDFSKPSGGGGCAVVAWIDELGLRRESFQDFLEGVLELCEAELTAVSAPALSRAG
ncbi:MAG: SMI1/KNR4 family protein [Sorangiineae bacterium]|nr:SMI1/KNR4 family protein [Polyangiaceae bacterium]MEB2323982.1 SMI1/KNR4 family protein [Sorangiineae bacterium]